MTLPDETMRDVRIVHDKVGSYADWCLNGVVPYGNWKEPYLLGKTKPNYPMPATIGFVPSGYGTYLIDTRKRVDGMPLFRGYTWEQWTK